MGPCALRNRPTTLSVPHSGFLAYSPPTKKNSYRT